MFYFNTNSVFADLFHLHMTRAPWYFPSCQDQTKTNFLRHNTSCSLFSSGQSPFHSTLTAPFKSRTLILTVVVSSFSNIEDINIVHLYRPRLSSGKKDWSVFLFQCINLQVEDPVHHLDYLGHMMEMLGWVITHSHETLLLDLYSVTCITVIIGVTKLQNVQ